MNKIFRRANRQVIHHLQPTGDNAIGDDVTNRKSGFFYRVKAG
ncbi:hypothetical protein ExPUPEC61_00919 [Escherichia coli]|nr:hypothetical protein ExPUPEC61_00919 [Escherichia coli]